MVSCVVRAIMTVLIEAIFGCVDEVLGSLLEFGVGTDVIDVVPGPAGLVSVTLK